ncbi:MAG TPA: hypothetical protein VHH15_11630 [Actinophytocola sp.]|nr:hypothetical protein [Actinophytocola sp.]
MAANDVVDHQATPTGVTREQRGRAARAVASYAADANECVLLLDMLGLPVPEPRRGETEL